MKCAVAQGYRQDTAGDAIGAALPKNGVARKRHRALPHAEVASAIATIRASRAHWATVAAPEFGTPTASRSGEVSKSRWDEVDLEAATWTVPAESMKMKREHRVSLSGRALQTLTKAPLMVDGSGLIFPSVRGRPLSGSPLSRQGGSEAFPRLPWIPQQLARLVCRVLERTAGGL